jgi:hypothetical protein
MKKIVALLLLLLNFVIQEIHAQIPNNFFGINYWMPNTIGTVNFGGNVQNLLAPNIQNSGVKIIRVGGNGYDTDGGNLATYTSDYVTACQNIIAIGAEPLVQIPVKHNNTYAVTATQAAQLVYDLNVTNGLNVKYFSIGNEYDKYTSPNNTNTNFSSKFKAFSVAMKNAYPTAKDDILIVGPSPSFFYAPLSGPQVLSNLIGSPGGSDDITGEIPTLLGYYYLDIIDWHVYPWDNSVPFTFITRRNAVINYPSDPSTSGLVGNITQMNTWINNANTFHIRPVAKRLKFGITEMNINYYNPPYAGVVDDNNNLKNSVPGLGCHSYIAGQFWADMFGQMLQVGGANATFMIPWSVHESGGNRQIEDFGVFDQAYPNVKERSTYYHLQLMAKNFKGTFFPNTYTSNNYQHKAYAYRNTALNEIGVLLMNQFLTSPPSVLGHNFSIHFNNGATTGPFHARFAMGLNASYDCFIKTETTALLVFDATTGAFKRRIEYCIDDAINNLPPKTWLAGNAYIKDTPSDVGIEPYYGNNWDLPISPDVWARNPTAPSTYPDFATGGVYTGNPAHQNPEYSGNPALYPKIFVRVNNPSCGGNAINGTIYLYQIPNTLADSWNNSTWGTWTLIGTKPVVNLAPGGTYVEEFIWNLSSVTAPPLGNSFGHCLSARFLSSTDPMFWEPATGFVGNNIKYNNNWVQKNILLENFINNGIKPLNYGNQSITPKNIEIIFTASLAPGTTSTFIDKGTVEVDLSELGYRKWVQGGKLGTGIVSGNEKYVHISASGQSHTHEHLKPDPKRNFIRVVSPNASIGNLQMDPEEMATMGLQFHYISTNAENSEYNFDVRQMSNGEYSGNMRYQITPLDCQGVNAGNDITVGSRCPAQLSATPLIEGATYIWRNDANGKEVCTGASIQVNPRITTSYEVEMSSPGGCVVYDIVTVNVGGGNPPCQPPCGPPDYFDVVLSSNTTISGQDIVIGKTLEVPNGIVLTINSSKVSFHENAKILVRQGGKLIITNSHLRACDDTKKWKGVVIKGNNTDGGQFRISGSVIMDAITPIDMFKVIGATILQNIFDNGTNAIVMDKCKRFIIQNNQFDANDIAIIATRGVVDSEPSIMKGNYFTDVVTAVQLLNGDHSSLDITCNTFNGYANHAVYSDSTVMKNQGSLAEGAGNIFISSSTQTNHQFRHKGNIIIYFYDPSNPVILNPLDGTTAASQSALADASCDPAGTGAKMANSDGSDSDKGKSIEERINELEFKVYPNPFNSSFIVTSSTLESSTIEIYNAVGSLIYSANAKAHKTDIDLSRQASGIYFVRLTNAQGSLIKKIIKE